MASPWQVIGAPPAGAIAALALASADTERTILFAGAKTGLYRCVGFGSAMPGVWERLPAAPVGVMSLAVSPTFARDHTLFAGADAGIFVSNDEGDHWRAATIPHMHTMVLSLACSPHYAEDGIVLAGTLQDGVWFSDTRGERWAARNFGLLDASVFALAFSPCFSEDETAFATTDTALYYTYNGARAWKPLAFPEDGAPVLSVAVSPHFASDHTLYVGAEQKGLLISQDSGESWQRSRLSAQSVSAIVVDELTLLVGTESGIFQSLDQGNTWTCLTDAPEVLCLQKHGLVMAAGLASGGIWAPSSVGQGAAWRPIDTPPCRSMLGMALMPDFERNLRGFMYGVQEGIWRTNDGGLSWQSLNEQLPSLDIHALALSPAFTANSLVAATSPQGCFVSADGGDHWRIALDRPCGPIVFSPNGRYVAVSQADAGLCVSEDSGHTWSSLAGPWDAVGQIVALAIDEDQRVYVAVRHGVDDSVTLWHGWDDHYTPVLSQPGGAHPVVSLCVPGGSAASWYTSLGRTVWRVQASSVISSSQVDAEGAEPLLGLAFRDGMLYAYSSRHLYQSRDGRTWQGVQDFGSQPAIAFDLTPQHAYAMLLGGAFCRGVL
jgi:photosystem II stability/assembly factor-like uncharacterized protein